MKKRELMKPWHDSELVITKWGLNQMRYLVIVGVVLGFLLGVCATILFF